MKTEDLNSNRLEGDRLDVPNESDCLVSQSEIDLDGVHSAEQNEFLKAMVNILLSFIFSIYWCKGNYFEFKALFTASTIQVGMDVNDSKNNISFDHYLFNSFEWNKIKP